MSLARLTQLFAEGTELVLEVPHVPGQPKPEPVVLWIAKLNAFQEEQANSAGRVARARLVNAIRRVGTPEWELVQSQKGDALNSAMVMAIVQSKESELFIKAMNAMRADEDWRERLEIMDQTEEEKLEGVEKEAHVLMRNEFNADLLDRHKVLLDDYKHDLEEMSREDLEEHFENAFLNEQGMAAFGIERARWHLYLCMRICQASPPADDNARWDHSGCDHEQMFLANVEEADRLPQSVRDKVEQAYAVVAVPPSVARFTGALASSSASPEPSAPEAASTPSGPEVTSTVPATT
jgi:hypothetical protein